MTDTPLTPEENDQALAAEYVLGLDDLTIRSQIEARLKTDSAFAALVAAWETRFAGMNDEFEEAPAPNLLPRIEARLFPQPAPVKRSWFSWLAGAATAAAVAYGAYVMIAPPPQGAVVAELAAEAGSLAYEARYDTDHLVVTRVAGSRPAAGQDHELWIIAPGQNPVSLGVLGDAPLSVAYPRPPAGWVLAVSVEQTGGSPTGAPQGPVILTGEIKA
jgi:anti-sigma-K factor RskA